ncbi:MAG: TrmH family RNA methyltransferase [Planctomycetota bacterium]
MTALDRIRSRRNPRIQAIRAIRAGKNRDRVLLEGGHLVEEALESGWEVRWLLFTEEGLAASDRKVLSRAAARGVDAFPCDAGILEEVRDLDSPGRLLGVASRPRTELAAVLDGARSPGAFVVVSAGIQDPRNLGALIRSVAGLGAAGVVVLAGGVSPWHPRALRGASGTTFRIPVAEGISAEALIGDAGERGLELWAADAEGEDPRKIRRDGPVALLLGEEGRGLPAPLAARSARKVGIPLSRGVESLNVAAAGAILAFVLGEQG